MNFNTKISLTLPRKIEGEELRHILTEHAEWLKDHDNGKRADLSNITLFGADLQGADLSYADFSGADMMCANLSGTNLVSPFFTASIAGCASGFMETNHCLETLGSILVWHL